MNDRTQPNYFRVLVAAVSEMRSLQLRFYACRDNVERTLLLIECKEQEKAVDRLLAQLHAPVGGLFD